MEVDQVCQLLNQLELNLISRKPFVNQLLGIISFCDKAERLIPPCNLNHGVDKLVDEDFGSLCDSLEDCNTSNEHKKISPITHGSSPSTSAPIVTERSNLLPITDINEFDYLSSGSVGSGSLLVNTRFTQRQSLLGLVTSFKSQSGTPTRKGLEESELVSDYRNSYLTDEHDEIIRSSGFFHGIFNMAWSSAQKVKLLDYYLSFLQHHFFVAYVIIWFAVEISSLIAFVILWFLLVLSCMLSLFYCNDNSHSYRVISVCTALRQIQQDFYLFVLSIMVRSCHLLGIMLKPRCIAYFYGVDNHYWIVGMPVGININQLQLVPYLIEHTVVEKIEMEIQHNVVEKTEMEVYLLDREWSHPSSLSFEKLDASCCYTLCGDDCYCKGKSMKVVFGFKAICGDYKHLTVHLPITTRQILLDFYLFELAGCVCKGDCRTFQFSTVGKKITYRQIRLDVYLFSREWNCFNILAPRNYNTNCLHMLPVYIQGALSCGVDVGKVQHADYCFVLDQFIKYDLAILCTFGSLHKLDITKINTSTQIKLDLYLFSRDLNGLISPALFECESDYLNSFEDERTCWVSFSMGDSSPTMNGSQSTSLGFWSGNHYIWHGYKEFVIFFVSWSFPKDHLAMFFPYNQSGILNFCDCLQDFNLHFYLIYLDIRPLSHFTPSARAWAVSTYIFYECRMHSVDVHKGIARMGNEYVSEVLLGFFVGYSFCAIGNIVVLSSISLGGASVTDVYVFSCNSSVLQHLLYHSSDEKRDTYPLSQNSSEGLGAVCCASFPLWCASSCYPQVGRAFTYLDRIIVWFICSPTTGL